MNYIFCPSYASVFFALHLKNLGKKIKIITDNISVKKYCKIVHINCIYFDYLDVSITKVYKIFVLKNRIKNIVKKIAIKKDDNFYLLDNTFCYEGFYLAKEWSKKGNVYFSDLAPVYPRKYMKNNYSSLNFWNYIFLKCLFKIFLDMDLVILEDNCRPFFGFDNNFLKKNKIKKKSLDIDFKELKLDVMKRNYVKQKECDNLIVTSGLISTNIVNHTSLKRMYRHLFDLPHKFMIKAHPNPNFSDKGFFDNFEKYLDYIPAELLLANVGRNVLSVASSTLIPASQLEHLNAISLLELVEWINQSYKKKIKTWFIEESNNRIIFVKTLEELNKLLGV